ncbi:hypothetical protein A4D02_14625 [Niastella koreensis]|uniref:TonB-dependent receptor n=1 Tax=Niastella koreensis TaxID=354356 RepID=A0ABX3NPL8_9BACT|nr:hypothetical protein A4D02_14625 [Niastella koreensis]
MFGCLLGETNGLQAQNRMIHGFVINRLSKEIIPFASISWKQTKKGALTDSSGRFQLSMPGTEQDTLIISHVGFTTVQIPLSKNDTATLLVELALKQFDGVVVSSRYNRGLFWWNKVVQHKDINNPANFNNSSYQLYKKLEVGLNNVNREKLTHGVLKPFEFVFDNMDTSGSKPYLPVYMTETLSKCFSSGNPGKKRERILAVQTTGIKSDVVLQFIEGVNHTTNVYENSIMLFGKEFISPFSNHADAYYNFRAADTLVNGGKKYLHLFFTPRHEGENTFSGDCWLYSPTWAIQKVTFDISPTANINYVNRLTISQEFTQLNSRTWVFSKDKIIADISLHKKDKQSLLIHQTVAYKDVHINDPAIAALLDNNTEKEQVSVNDSARMRTADYWQQERPEPLTISEQKVYKMIDTLSQLPLFKQYTNTMGFIVGGCKKIGIIEIGPWYKWISASQLEKWRLRFDLGTTEQFSKSLYLHSYIAYGLGDHKLKGKAEGRYTLPGNSGYSFQASYLHDLDNGGVAPNDDGVSMDNMFSQLIRRPNIRQKFLEVDEVKAGITKEWSNRLSARIFMTRTSYETFTPLPPKKLLSINQNDIDNTELSLSVRYAPGEKKLVTRRKTIRRFGKAPVLEAQYMTGMKGLFGGQYKYHKMNIAMSQHLRLTGWGKIDYQAYAGKIWSGALPFMLLEVHPGNETYYYSKQAFNLMNRFEYFSDRYAGFSIEHNFEKKLLNLLPFMRKVNVRQFWNIKAVCGDLSPENKKLNCREYSNYRLTSLQARPYVEVGTGLDNIFRFFRADLVWRLKNRAYMPTGPQQPPIAKFGVFGSFHVQF